jgi:hypothetical protein
MLTTIEAEIDVNGIVTFLEPLKINKKSRAIIMLLDNETPKKNATQAIVKKEESGNFETDEAEKERRRLQMEWLKANRAEFGGQYVILDGDKLLGVAKSYPEGRQIAKESNAANVFVTYLSKPDEAGYIGGWE